MGLKHMDCYVKRKIIYNLHQTSPQTTPTTDRLITHHSSTIQQSPSTKQKKSGIRSSRHNPHHHAPITVTKITKSNQNNLKKPICTFHLH